MGLDQLRTRRGIVTISATLLVVATVVIAVMVLATTSRKTTPHGARSAAAAAKSFVAALNAGNGTSAAGVSCTSFTDQARSLARSGVDPAFRFRLGALTTGVGQVTAQLKEDVDVGGTKQSTTYTLTMTRLGGRWLVCGQSEPG
jgi:hypothetical protein